MSLETIILAGGKGTRLASLLHEIPKPMIDVDGKPFLHYQFEWLKKNGVKHVILSVGHQAQVIVDYFRDNYLDIQIQYYIEQKPLGTGGAITSCLSKIQGQEFMVLNGDTFFPISLTDLIQKHQKNNHVVTLALKELHEFDRYGTVHVNEYQQITGFEEKGYKARGLINGGIYLFNKDNFDVTLFPEVFSIERDYFEAYFSQTPMYGYVYKDYFRDIGIPEDYYKFIQDIRTKAIL